NTGKCSKKVERIQDEYNRVTEPESSIRTVIGHALSTTSFERFENAIKRHTSDQDEDFRQYLNKLMFEKDITQATISRRSFIKGAALSRYINGSREVKKYIVFRIALSLKLNLLETETLLRKVGKGFKETRMDGVIIESIEQGI